VVHKHAQEGQPMINKAQFSPSDLIKSTKYNDARSLG